MVLGWAEARRWLEPGGEDEVLVAQPGAFEIDEYAA
jgi:hypothetical protein